MSNDILKMTKEMQDRVREVAYLMWEAAGRQHGMAVEYWVAAERQVREMMENAAKSIFPSPTSQAAAAPKTSGPKASAPKAEPANDDGSFAIQVIQGIGPAFGAKLAAVGIKTPDDLLAACGTAKGRTEISEKTEIATRQLLKWANMADLMRIPGVDGQAAELLETAGVDTVKELRRRRADNLAAKIAEVGGSSASVPSADQVAAWVAAAKTLDPKISH